jgi:hypothetical protein
MLIESARSLTDRHLLFVANGFYVLAAGLALPSAPGFLYFGWAALRIRMLSPPPAAAGTSPSPAVRMIEAGANVFGAFFRFIGTAGEWVFTALAIAFFLALLAALILFLTGRGLHADATWARILAGLFSAGFLLASLGAMLALRRGWMPLIALAAAGPVYTIWTLVRPIR